MATAKKGNLFRLRLKRVPKGIEVSVLTEPVLYESFKASAGTRTRLTTEDDGGQVVRIPRAAAALIEEDRELAPFLFQENPTTLICPVSRTKEQLVGLAQAARDFVSRWYESRLQPLSVETSIAVRLSDSIEMQPQPVGERVVAS